MILSKKKTSKILASAVIGATLLGGVAGTASANEVSKPLETNNTKSYVQPFYNSTFYKVRTIATWYNLTADYDYTSERVYIASSTKKVYFTDSKLRSYGAKLVNGSWEMTEGAFVTMITEAGLR